MRTAIMYGSNLASFCVEKFGTERMIDLSYDEISNRMFLFKQLTHFDIDL